MSGTERPPGSPVIGILGWEEEENSRLPGSLANPASFRFPVLFRRVQGACYETIIENPDRRVLGAMVEAAMELEASGVRAITTSCGFNGIFQDELAGAVSVPVFASALVQVPMIHALFATDRRTGIITANGARLTAEHLVKAGIPGTIPVCVAGIEHTEAFPNVCLRPRPELLHLGRFREEVISVARGLVEDNDNVGAIVLEMTVLHIFANDIRKAVGLPVFDIVTLADYIYRVIVPE